MSSRDRSLIAVLLLVVVAVGGYFLIVQPQHSKANQLQTQITSEQAQLTTAEQNVQKGEEAEAEYKLYEKQYSAILAAVPSDDQIPELINELQSASTKTKVGFQTVSLTADDAAPPAATPGATAITFPSSSFSLSFTGSYFAVANLLGKLGSFVRADDKHFYATGRLLSISTVDENPGQTTGTSAGTTVPGEVTASVTAVDYDVPASATTTP